MISPMADLVRAVLGHVDRHELIDLAGALIRIPSFKTEETPVALFLEAFFRRRGYDVDLQEIEPGRFQTIATLRGTGGGASLMLNGHTDINALTRRWSRTALTTRAISGRPASRVCSTVPPPSAATRTRTTPASS